MSLFPTLKQMDEHTTDAWRLYDCEKLIRRFSRYMADFQSGRITQGQLMSALDVLSIDADNTLTHVDSRPTPEST